MKHSHNPQIKNLIITNDTRFNTKGLKRESGTHKKSYFTEKQCLMLPQALSNVDTLLLTFFGLLFGGRFVALADLTPNAIDYDARVIGVFESKVQRLVMKPVFEPELTLIKQYITDTQFMPDQKMFKRNIKEYNMELSATKDWFAKTDCPLSWKPTTHTAFKHTCVTQMSLHGVRLDTISDYVGTDPNTLKEFYMGGGELNVLREIGGWKVEHYAASWSVFRYELTAVFVKRYMELSGRVVVLPLFEECQQVV
jgi:hypothetical protein